MNITKLFERAKHDLISHGEHRPVLHIEAIEGVTTLEFTQFTLETALEKMKEFFAQGRSYGKKHPSAELRQLALIIESWMSHNPDYAFPSNDPEREEHLGIWIYDIDGKSIHQRAYTAEIIRSGETLDLLELGEVQVGHNKLLYGFLAGFASKDLSDGAFDRLIERYSATY